MSMNEWDFVHEDVAPLDIALFEMAPNISFNDTHCLAHIMLSLIHISEPTRPY